MVGSQEIPNEYSQKAGKHYSAVFHKRAISLIFQAEVKENVIDIHSYPESTIGPIMDEKEETVVKLRPLR